MMASLTSGIGCRLNRMKVHKWRTTSQTFFGNWEKCVHSSIASNLNAPELHGSVFFKGGHNPGPSYLNRSTVKLSVGNVKDCKLKEIKHVDVLNFENIISCPLKLHRPMNSSSTQKMCDSAKKLPNITRGQYAKFQGRSCQNAVRGISTQCGLPTRSSFFIHSVQTCGPESFTYRHIGTSTIDQKKKDGIKKSLDGVKDVDKKGDKSRKNIRKKVQPIIRQVPSQATVYAVGDDLDFQSFKEHLAVEQLFEVSQTPDDLLDKVIHVTSRYQPENYPKKDIFFFSEGSVVFWNVPEAERLQILKDMMKHCEELIGMKLIMDESDSLEVQPTKLETFLNKDIININEDLEAAELMLVKYAVSNALSQSVKLSIWETELNRHSVECEHISESLRKGKKVFMTKQMILKTLGTIFAIRHSMNLGSELLDTPDFYWDRDKLGDLYKQCYSHLCVPHRIKVMNEKMSYCIELLELIKDLESDRRHVRLEWIIIILIALEVLLELHEIFWRRYISKEVE